MLAMKDAGVDMLTLANGQTLDMLFEGLQQTIANCKTAEMDYIGAFASQEEFETPKIVDINGINVGFLNYTTTMGGMEAQSKADALTYGVATTTNTNPVRTCRGPATPARTWSSPTSAGARWARASWAMRSSTPPRAWRRPAWTCSSASIRTPSSRRAGSTCSWRMARPTACSACCGTGNFLSDQRDQYTCNGIVFEFTIEETSAGVFEITEPVYIPTYVWRYEAEDGEGYEYRVLAVGEWLENRPEGMDDEEYSRLQAVWDDIQETMAQGNVNATLSAN